MRYRSFPFAPRQSLGGLLPCLLGATLCAPLAPASAEICSASGEHARVAAIVDDLDVALEDGRTLRLAGLDPARATPSDPTLGERMRKTLAERLVGRDVTVTVLSAGPDRWERYPALAALPRASASPDPDAASLNETLLGEGVARVRPEAVARACLSRFLAGEAAARTAGLGLWSDPYYAVLKADDRKGLAERSGAMALVEGRAGLRRTRGWVDLDLGHGRSGLAATFSGRDLKRLAQAGIDLKALVGATLRIRGFLDDRFGPRIEVKDAGQIEVVSGPLQNPEMPRGTPHDTVGQDGAAMKDGTE